MSLERRKPFAPLHPNAKPTDPVLTPHSAPPHPAISRPRRQMQQYYHHQPHQQYNPHKRYATVLPGSSRSSATSSAESVYSTANSIPTRRRKLSAAEDVAARVRARWAALEALERTSSAPGPIANPADTISATNNTNTAAATTTTNATSNTAIRSGARTRIDSHANPEWRQYNWAGLEAREREHALLLEVGKEREKENERSMSMAMQVDGHEKPLPPRPAPLALALHLNPGQGPLSAPAHMRTAPTMAMAMTPMAIDRHEEDKNGSTPREDDDAGAGAGAGGETSDSTLRTTPTSLTCYETTESQRQVLQRRPTRALTPPQVRRRPSITDELEEAVRSVPNSPNYTHQFIHMDMGMWMLAFVERRGHPGHVANLAHGRSIVLSAARMQRAPIRRTRAYLPLAHPCRRSWGIYMCAMRRCVRERTRTHPARVCAAASEGYVYLFFIFTAYIPCVPHRLTIELPFFFFSLPLSSFLFQLVERLRSVVRAWTCLSLTNQGFGAQQPWQPQQQPPSKHYKRKDDNNYY